MKIRSVKADDRNGEFLVRLSARTLSLSYSKACPRPGPSARIEKVWVDADAGREAFSYQLSTGEQGTIHIEQVLEQSQDPDYLRDLLLYKLTLEAQSRIAAVTALSKTEVARRLGISTSRLCRLLDQANYRKSVDQLLRLLHVLNAEVDLVVRGGGPSSRAAA